MKVWAINHSDIQGGAARAAYRIHHAVRGCGVDSTMQVNSAVAGDWTVQSPASRRAKATALFGPPLAGLLTKTLKTGNSVLHSPAVIPSRWHHVINRSDIDVVHMHWINSEMVSVADAGKITKPVVWTLHDMWAFCGAEHYTEDLRWRDGYKKQNRPAYESGWDINRWTAWRKKRNWRTPVSVVAPSRWLADCARQSALMQGWPICCVPNAIDTETWCPMDKSIARSLLGLPQNVPLVLFGAMTGVGIPRKGFDLLQTALGYLSGQMANFQLVVFGQLPPRQAPDLGFPVHYMGHLYDDLSMRMVYSAADVMVIPSRQDNLPNTGVEAHACGTPVVAFNTCGLPDIVEHQVTGYLAKAFDAQDLAVGIGWVLQNRQRLVELGHAARLRALTLWSTAVVGLQYLAVYQSAIDAQIRKNA